MDEGPAEAERLKRDEAADEAGGQVGESETRALNRA